MTFPNDIPGYVASLTDQQVADLLRDFDAYVCPREGEFLANIQKHPLIFEALKATRPDWEKYDFNNFWSGDLRSELGHRAAEILKRMMP